MTTPFGKAVRHLRDRKGVSQKDMAKALGVSPAYLSALENGKRVFDVTAAGNELDDAFQIAASFWRPVDRPISHAR